MALDGYSLCPGGRNKKIRFCCPDMLKELEQVSNLLADDQFKACVNLIEDLEKKHPDCACLTSAKLVALRSQNQWDAFQVVAEGFYQREPQNGTAVSEFAVAKAVFGEDQEALSLLVDGFEIPEEGKGLNTVVMAAQIIAQILCQSGSPISGLAVAKLLPAYLSQSQEVTVFLRDLISQVTLPAPLKGLRFNPYAPDSFPAKQEYDTLAPLIATGRWKKAMVQLEKLAQHAENWPGVLMSLALLQLWMSRAEEAFATLRKYAALPGLSDEDQADAFAMIYMIDRRNLKDEVDIVNWETTVTDYDRALERLISSPRFYSVDFDPRRYAQTDQPGPKKIFMILDRPFAPDDVAPGIGNIVRQVATVMLFGKQTDRDARIEVLESLDTNREAIMSLLCETLQDTISEVKTPVVTRSVSIIMANIDGRIRFKNSNPPTRQQIDQIMHDYVSENGPFQYWWLNQPFEVLGNQSPLAAAADPQYKASLLGMIEMVEFLFPSRFALEASNALRKKLGFIALGAIEIPAEDTELALSQIPVSRWHRINTEGISNDSLAGELAMLDLISEDRGALHFANAVLERPLKEIDPQIRGLAFRILIDNAEELDDTENAMLWIDRARNESKELNFSTAEWDVAELMVRIKEQNQPEAMRMIEHIMRHHKNDQRAMAALQSLFVQMGLLNPDGTPTAYARQQPQTQKPKLVRTFGDTDVEIVPPQTSSQAGSAEKKLWVPD